MIYKTVNEYKEEPHPWPPFIPANASKLILGTFPTNESNRTAYEFFYPNPLNDFWKVLFEVAGKDLNKYVTSEPVEIRKQILSDLKLGIADIGKRILRQKNSSEDENLFPIEFTDIFSLLENHQTIAKIIITSSSGANSVLSWFQQYCTLNDINFVIKKGNLPITSRFVFNNREIVVDIISSPSRLSPIRGDRLFQMYREAILE
jgi:G:T/U-mismatch repair DNA glycosylase